MSEPHSEADSGTPRESVPSGADFIEAANTEAPSLAREFLDFLRDNKKWWLGPIVLTLLIVSFLLVVGGSAAPFIYALF